MAKRKPLSFDNEELSGNLKKSAAKGIDAFFSASAALPSPDDRKADTGVGKSDGQSDAAPLSKQSRENRKKATPKKKKPDIETKQPRHHDTMIPFNHDTTVSGHDDTIIQTVRRAAKMIGKEAATHRFTEEEKRAIADIIYAYKGQGIRTSENEIARIAINFLVEDYRENGENSVLHKVLQALNE